MSKGTSSEQAKAIANKYTFESPVFRSMLISDIATTLAAAREAQAQACIEILQERRAAYPETVFIPLREGETTAPGVDQTLITRVSAQMARHTLDQMIAEVRAAVHQTGERERRMREEGVTEADIEETRFPTSFQDSER